MMRSDTGISRRAILGGALWGLAALMLGRFLPRTRLPGGRGGVAGAAQQPRQPHVESGLKVGAAQQPRFGAREALFYEREDRS